jgi:DNA-binding MarR family transcriptional regulator
MAGALAEQDYKALGEFRRALRELLAFSDAAAREEGLTSQQHQALLAIRAAGEGGPISVGELAQSLLVRNHTALELADRLVDRRLIVRERSLSDRRRILLSLTPGGAEVLERISLSNVAGYGGAAEHLSEVLRRVRRLDRSRRRRAGLTAVPSGLRLPT